MNEQEQKGQWLRSTGGLFTYQPGASPSTKNRIYGEGTYAVFLSHIADYKKPVSEIKQELAPYGVSCFVAHEDIEPNTMWANEIMDALYSADLLVALMTNGYHESNWTDQEIGCAIGRGIPVIAMNIDGTVPYGIIGQFQGYKTTLEKAATDLLEFLAAEEKYHKAWVNKVQELASYDEANRFAAKTFHLIKHISHENVNALIEAWACNSEAQGSHAFQGLRNFWQIGCPKKSIKEYIVEWDSENYPDVAAVDAACGKIQAERTSSIEWT